MHCMLELRLLQRSWQRAAWRALLAQAKTTSEGFR